MEPPLVAKVGGSLLRRREDYDTVAEALEARMAQGPLWAVVSAAKGVTDALERVAAGTEDPEGVLSWHERLAGGPLEPALADAFRHAVAAARRGLPAELLAWGEQASSMTLRQALARRGLHVPLVELAPHAPAPRVPHAIIPGFYVRGRARLHVLPRGGSDISAVLAARWRGSAEVELWKEGGGIRLQPGVTVDQVDAGTLLSWLGDRIRPVHPSAVRLARRFGLGLTLKDPWGADGSTRIAGAASAPSSLAERAVGEALP